MDEAKTHQRAAGWDQSKTVENSFCEISKCNSTNVRRTEDGVLCYKCYMNTKFCDHIHCTKVAALKCKGKWVCREHLCPPPDEEYLALERMGQAGLHSNAFNWKNVTVVDYSPSEDDDDGGIFLDNSTEK